MKKRTPGLEGCARCLKFVMMFGNCIFALIGLAVIGGGVFLAVDKLRFVTAVFGIPLVASASYVIIAAGCIIFLISFAGCIGAVIENRFLMLIYCSVLLVVFLLAVVGIVLAVVFRTWIQEQIRTYMTSTITYEYGVNLDKEWNKIVTSSWDEAQQRWYCCGVDNESWGVYRGSEWYKIQIGVIDVSKPYVPESCCIKDQYGEYSNKGKCQNWIQGPPGRQSGLKNEYLFYRGCYVAGKDILYQIAGYLIAIGVILALLVIGAVIVSLLLIRNL